MHIWVVKGWPGMGMPRAFIIAMASGGMAGIFGMLGISMVEVTDHRPTLPCAAIAATGARIKAVPIRVQIRERRMLLSLLATRRVWRSGCLPSIMVAGG